MTLPTAACLALVAASFSEPLAPAQARVHGEVRAMMQADKGRVLFTDLWNGDRLNAAEREYAARLYEVFFALPAHVQDELKARGVPPAPAEIAANYGLAPEAVDLLLEIMTSEPRMPKLFGRDPATGAITDVDKAALEAFVRTRGSEVRVSGWKDKPLPTFALPGVLGGTLTSADLAGKPVLVYVWLTRCPVCRRVTPSVVELDKRFGPRGLKIVGLNADTVLDLKVPEAERESWLREQGVRYANASLDAAARSAFGQNIFPAFFLVGRDGRVRELVLNERSLDELSALVEPLLQEPRPATSQR
jgi:thiol-disulfide isomerase/thioredoxin